MTNKNREYENELTDQYFLKTLLGASPKIFSDMCHCAFNRMCDRNTPKHPLRSFTTTHKMSKLRFFFHVHAKLCNCTCTLNFSYISPVWALSRSKNTLEDTFQGKWNYVQGIVILHLYNYRMWLKSSLASHIVVPWTENITTWRMPSF